MTENIVVVPDLSAADLTALAARELELNHFLGPVFAGWDYHRDFDGNEIQGRGRKFEFLVWVPDSSQLKGCIRWGSEPWYYDGISSEDARKHIRDLGFCGHTAAFVQWRRTCDLHGTYVTIPEDGACFRGSDGKRHLPTSYFDDRTRTLVLESFLNSGWESAIFVGFKMLDD